MYVCVIVYLFDYIYFLSKTVKANYHQTLLSISTLFFCTINTMLKYLVGISAVSALRMEASNDAMGQLNGTHWLFQPKDIPDGGQPKDIPDGGYLLGYAPCACVLEFHGNLAKETTYASFNGDPNGYFTFRSSFQEYVPVVENIDFQNHQLTLKRGDKTIVLEQAEKKGHRFEKMGSCLPFPPR